MTGRGQLAAGECLAWLGGGLVVMEQALGRAIDDVVREKPATTTLLPFIERLNGPRLSGVIPVGIEVITHSHRRLWHGP